MPRQLIKPLTLKDIRATAPDITASKSDLLPYLKRIAKTANMRIQRLEKKGVETYAIKKLYERLEDIDAVTIGARIKIDESMSVTNIRKEIKAVEYFLGSAGSTTTGIKEADANRVRGAEEYLELTATQAEAIIESMKQVSQKKALKSLSLSEIYRLGYQAKRKHMGFSGFVELVENYMTDVDDELKDVLQSIWDDINKN